MSLLFSTLSGFVIAFFSRSKRLNFLAAVTVHSDFWAQENKICHCFHFLLSTAVKWQGKYINLDLQFFLWNCDGLTITDHLELLKGSIQFSHSVMSNSLWPHRPQFSRLPCPTPSPRACWNSCPLSPWCHPTISSSVVPFSSHLQSFPASGSFSMSWLFVPGSQSTEASALESVPPKNIDDWFPSGLTGWISLLSKGLSRVFSNTTVQKHQFFSTQLSLWSNFQIHTWLLEKSLLCLDGPLSAK